MSIFEELKHIDKAPQVTREMRNSLDYIINLLANAADKIESLEKENSELKKQLTHYKDLVRKYEQD